MKKLLLFSGLGLTGFAFYYFFKKQIALATNIDYNLSNLQVLSMDTDKAVIKAEIKVSNKSSFEVEILDYEMQFSYDGKPFAKTLSNKSFTVKPDSYFLIDTTGEIDVKGTLKALLPFLEDVVKSKPIAIDINGFIKINFLGINHTIQIENEKFTYSQNLLSDLGWQDEVDTFKSKLQDLIGVSI